MSGGAEQATENLVAALLRSGHRAEAVRLPTAWDRVRIFDAALAWRLVPVDADLVIAVNFPAYFVNHPNKVVWLFHQHRAAYDGAGGPWSDLGSDPDSLETRRILTEWDTLALEESRALFAISELAAARLAGFNGLTAEPLYHPPPLFDDLHPGAFGDAVFCATRLEGNKRPGVMVEAIARTRSGTRLEIAGRGSLAGELQTLACDLGVSERVEMLGFVPDDELVRRYADALAVVYAPFEEDYGYVTLQAFRAGKPVITAADSGGVLEWVEDGVNGFVTDGSPEAIAAAVDTLADDRALAAKMGAAGRERVAHLSWDPVIERLTRP